MTLVPRRLPPRTPKSRNRFIPSLEALEARLVPSSAPVATPDQYGVFHSHTLVVEGGGRAPE